MSFPVVLDGLVAVLLVVTIAYSAILYRRLSVLRRSQSEMAGLVKGFSDATERAQAGLLSIKTSSRELSSVLQERIDEARAIADDLRFLTETGNRLADRLDAGVAAGRARADAEAAGVAAATPAPSEAERDLAGVLRRTRVG